MVSYVEGLRVSIKIQIEFAMTDVSFKSPRPIRATYPRGPAGTCRALDLASAACVHTVTVSGHANRTMYEI